MTVHSLSSLLGFVPQYFLISLALLLATAGQKHTERINKLPLTESLEKELCPSWDEGTQDSKRNVRRELSSTDPKPEVHLSEPLSVCYRLLPESEILAVKKILGISPQRKH